MEATTLLKYDTRIKNEESISQKLSKNKVPEWNTITELVVYIQEEVNRRVQKILQENCVSEESSLFE